MVEVQKIPPDQFLLLNIRRIFDERILHRTLRNRGDFYALHEWLKLIMISC